MWRRFRQAKAERDALAMRAGVLETRMDAMASCCDEVKQLIADEHKYAHDGLDTAQWAMQQLIERVERLEQRVTDNRTYSEQGLDAAQVTVQGVIAQIDMLRERIEELENA
jgi:hypothetical protein